MKVDTNDLWHDECKTVMPFEPSWYVQAAEAATEVGQDDYDDSAPEGFAVALLCVIGCFGAAMLLAAAF